MPRLDLNHDFKLIAFENREEDIRSNRQLTAQQRTTFLANLQAERRAYEAAYARQQTEAAAAAKKVSSARLVNEYLDRVIADQAFTGQINAKAYRLWLDRQPENRRLEIHAMKLLQLMSDPVTGVKDTGAGFYFLGQTVVTQRELLGAIEASFGLYGFLPERTFLSMLRSVAYGLDGNDPQALRSAAIDAIAATAPVEPPPADDLTVADMLLIQDIVNAGSDFDPEDHLESSEEPEAQPE